MPYSSARAALPNHATEWAAPRNHEYQAGGGRAPALPRLAHSRESCSSAGSCRCRMSPRARGCPGGRGRLVARRCSAAVCGHPQECKGRTGPDFEACQPACLPASLAPSLPRPGTEAERSVPLPALRDQTRTPPAAPVHRSAQLLEPTISHAPRRPRPFILIAVLGLPHCFHVCGYTA